MAIELNAQQITALLLWELVTPVFNLIKLTNLGLQLTR